jgi:hypothetical protein
MCDWMGRFSGGTASRWKSRSEINVRTLAAATVVTTNSPCHRNRDSFGTISGIDIMRSEARRQTLLMTARQMMASSGCKTSRSQLRCRLHLTRHTTADQMAAHRKSDQCRDDLCGRTLSTPMLRLRYHLILLSASMATCLLRRVSSTHSLAVWDQEPFVHSRLQLLAT